MGGLLFSCQNLKVTTFEMNYYMCVPAFFLKPSVTEKVWWVVVVVEASTDIKGKDCGTRRNILGIKGVEFCCRKWPLFSYPSPPNLFYFSKKA